MLYSSNILFMPLLELSPTKKNQQTSESYALPSETSMVVERENSLNLSNFFIFMRRLLIWRSLSGVFWRGGGFLPVTFFRHCEPFYTHVIVSSFLPVIASPSLPVIARSETTKQSPRCTFLLVLGVLGGLLRSLRSLAMTVWGCRLAMTGRKRWLAMTTLSAKALHLAVLLTKTLYLPDAKFLSPRV